MRHLQTELNANQACTNTNVNRNITIPQDTVNAARDTVRKVNNCENTAQDKDGQDRLVSVTDLAWSKAKSAWYRYVKQDEREAKAADHEFNDNWKHYGVSDALFDGATLILGGGLGGFIGRGAVGALGRSAIKQVAGKTLGGSAQTISNGVKVATAAIGAEKKAAPVVNAINKASHYADNLIAQGKHAAEVLKHGSTKGHTNLSRRADKIIQDLEPQKEIVTALKQGGHGATAKVIEMEEKIRQSAAKAENILRQANAARTQRNSVLANLVPTLKSGSVLAGAGAGWFARNAIISPQRQEGAKRSSDVRVEMDTIAEHLQAKNKPVTAQVLVDIHTSLKRQNLDKGEPNKNGLDRREINALSQIIDDMHLK